ncbi:kinase-like domain-containing protein [Syncephalis fuscata]|nr:kinase-like domain-containing protein [Syncephalis fuscata]KAI9595091.1 kinase-like domain-containing protein [Syncephalis fuscata]
MPFSSYVPSLLTYFRTGDGFGCIVMSLANGITLKEYTKSLSSLQKDVELRDVVRQLLISLAYLHRSEWVHGDLKPDNVMVQVTPPRTDGKSRVQVTLIDFNLAFPTINGTSPPAGHTVGYTPPEFYGSKQTVSHSFDSWSLGATLYALFTGHAPYEIDYDEKGTTGVWSLEKRKEFMRSMLKHQQHSYQQLNCSEEAREFIETLMVIDPAKRVTVEEIMWHKWLK